MTLIEFATDPARLAMYNAWQARADTQEMLKLITDNLGPAGLKKDNQTGEKALYYAGGVDAFTGVLFVLTKLATLKDALKHQADATALAAEYGMKNILKTEFSQSVE